MKTARGSLFAVASLVIAHAAGAMQSSTAIPPESRLPRYKVEFLGSAVNVAAMNQSGVMVGTTGIGPNERGWVASHGSPLAPLPLPVGRISSWANDINEDGVIVGTVGSVSYADPRYGAIAAMWTPDGLGGYVVEELGKLPGDLGSNAVALNNLGDVVGYSQGGMFQRAVWFTAPNGLMDLSNLIFDPESINDQRVMVGYTIHCARLDLDTMIVEDLGVPPGNYTTTLGWSINEANQVVGQAILSTSTNCNRQAARYTDGIGWEILSGCGSANVAADINRNGDVIMRLNLYPYVRFEGLGTFRIEDLIVAPVGHWYLINTYGLAINDAKQLAVAGSNPATGESGILLLTRF